MTEDGIRCHFLYYISHARHPPGLVVVYAKHYAFAAAKRL